MSEPASTGDGSTAAPRRWGLVLGGGGVLGGAWTVGALQALQTVHGLDPRDAELIVGTSVGSMLAALLGAGVTVPELVSHQLGDRAGSGRLADLAWDYETSTGPSHPGLPRLRPGSAGLVAHTVGQLRHLPPTVLLAGLVPQGRGSLAAVETAVRSLVPQGWCPHPGVRVVAMDYRSGRRVAFGAPPAPEADLADAVTASCAIPGWYAPVRIGSGSYVDGGAWSATNLDLAAGLGLSQVFVLAPMVSFATDHPADWRARAERQWRSRVTRRCLREVALVHRSGTRVTVLGPGPEDLTVIGANLMDVERRQLVLTTSLTTSARALADPEALAYLPDPLPDLPQGPLVASTLPGRSRPDGDRSDGNRSDGNRSDGNRTDTDGHDLGGASNLWEAG